ncbi:uncharacterized protein LOC133173427 [Saccostrea echinata]|uniref:uncharacterized protein LOC133173427 n=1 Tax=Saccostrea echinata TaxID=191078 RepID=UPI002A81E8DA|nr:uncharacterized protein LOC133173427 [Saccostrea echinata]
MYSKEGILSNSVYRVEITPEMNCNGNYTEHKTRINTISAFPEMQTKNITKIVSENDVLECSLTGAYHPLSFTWQHLIGPDETIVRNFTTSLVRLRNVSYKDVGVYNCTVQYKLCGTLNQQMTSSGSIVFNVKGPPFIETSIGTLTLKPGQNITVTLKIISFPAPYDQVIIRSQGNNYVNNTVNYQNTLVPLKAYGKTIEVEGYMARLTMLNISEMWFGTNTIIVSNSFGNHSTSFIIQHSSENHIYNFIVKVLKENMYLLAGIGGGILVLFIIVLVITCKKKKGKTNLSLNSDTKHYEESGVATVGERMYSRPFSLSNTKKEEDVQKLTVREEPIELEQRQCASMFSCDGFDADEFQMDKILYDNHFAPGYK